MAATPVKTWTKLLGTSSGHFYARNTDQEDSIYVGGWTIGALDGQTKSGSADAFLTKHSMDGTKAMPLI